jgi:hypothetical protein
MDITEWLLLSPIWINTEFAQKISRTLRPMDITEWLLLLPIWIKTEFAQKISKNHKTYGHYWMVTSVTYMDQDRICPKNLKNHKTYGHYWIVTSVAYMDQHRIWQKISGTIKPMDITEWLLCCLYGSTLNFPKNLKNPKTYGHYWMVTSVTYMDQHRICPKISRTPKHMDMTIHWKALEEHFLLSDGITSFKMDSLRESLIL